uniref:Uncharacterized protein n=1 Tax=Anas platyrhynchos TaxID=8839 RepID=A0A8B9QY41_ANAPL
QNNFTIWIISSNVWECSQAFCRLQCKTSIHFVSSLPDGLRDSSGLMQRGSTGPRLQSFIAQREAEACAETWQKQCDKQMTEQGKSPLRSPKHT